MRRFEDVQTKIAWTDETEWISESADTVLKVSGLRVGDYVKVTATMNGKGPSGHNDPASHRREWRRYRFLTLDLRMVKFPKIQNLVCGHS